MSLNQKKRITTLMGAAGILVAVIGSSLSAVMILLGLAVFFVSAIFGYPLETLSPLREEAEPISDGALLQLQKRD